MATPRDPATASAVRILDTRAFAFHAAITAALRGGNRELALEYARAMQLIRGAVEYLEKE